MDTAPQDLKQESAVELTLREAADLYRVTVKTLALHLRCGRLVGYKSRGASGREWRVTTDAMDAAGYARRGEAAGGVGNGHGEELVRLRRETAASDALLECGRLRTAPATASGDQPPTEPELDPGTARWLIAAVTGGSTFTRSGEVTSQGSGGGPPTARPQLD